MLTKITVDGYKSIDHQELELGKITLFSGINSAGKTSVIQAILSLWQTGKEKTAAMQEEFIRLGKFADVRNDIKAVKSFKFELEAQNEGKSPQKIGECHRGSGSLGMTIFYPGERADWSRYQEGHKLVYLSVERVGVQNSYKVNLEDTHAIGAHGQYAYAYLAAHGQDPIEEAAFAYDSKKIGMSLKNQVNYWLGYLMGYYIQVNPVEDLDEVVVTFSNASNNQYHRAKHVGTGITYMAMLIISALSCHKGDTLIVENPEIHLHPRAQSGFMEFLTYLCKNGLQVLLESHSDHIYNGIRKCVKKKELKKEDAVIYFFELDENLQTRTQRIRLNGEGAEENHPYGMFDQFDDDLDELLDM